MQIEIDAGKNLSVGKMAQAYDLILKGATVVNHDGEGARNFGLAGGRIAAIGELVTPAQGQAVRFLDALPEEQSDSAGIIAATDRL